MHVMIIMNTMVFVNMIHIVMVKLIVFMNTHHGHASGNCFNIYGHFTRYATSHYFCKLKLYNFMCFVSNHHNDIPLNFAFRQHIVADTYNQMRLPRILIAAYNDIPLNFAFRQHIAATHATIRILHAQKEQHFYMETFTCKPLYISLHISTIYKTPSKLIDLQEECLIQMLE